MSNTKQHIIPERVQLRAASVGEVAQQWLCTLGETVRQLEATWDLRVGEVMSGGSESLVLPAVRSNGNQAILKLGMAGVCDVGLEAKVLRLTNGNGYVQLYEHSAEHNAILIERLGRPIGDLPLTADQQIDAICQTLKTAWVPLTEPNGFTTGAQKAKWLAEFIDELWTELDEPCAKATKHRALAFAEARQAAHDPSNCVLVHGDAHEMNTLRVLNSAETNPTYKFIDPDGMFAERACDLAVPMRGFNADLLASDPIKLGHARCDRIAHITNVDPAAIWQWGFMERVSTGLLLTKLKIEQEGREMLQIADLWANENALVF